MPPSFLQLLGYSCCTKNRSLCNMEFLAAKCLCKYINQTMVMKWKETERQVTKYYTNLQNMIQEIKNLLDCRNR